MYCEEQLCLNLAGRCTGPILRSLDFLQSSIAGLSLVGSTLASVVLQGCELACVVSHCGRGHLAVVRFSSHLFIDISLHLFVDIFLDFSSPPIVIDVFLVFFTASIYLLAMQCVYSV